MTCTILLVALAFTVTFIYGAQTENGPCNLTSEPCAMLNTDGVNTFANSLCNCPAGYNCENQWENNSALAPTLFDPLHKAEPTQLSFCQKKTLDLCEREQIAAIYVSLRKYDAKCRCLNNVVVLDTQERIDRKLIQLYKCHKEECSPTDICIKKYQTSNMTRVKHVFPCICPAGSRCDVDNLQPAESDSEGGYSLSTCRQY